MITCRSNQNGRLIAHLDAQSLASYGIKHNTAANLLFHTNGDLDDYPDWLESYPDRVDAVIQDSEAAIRANFARVIQISKGTPS